MANSTIPTALTGVPTSAQNALTKVTLTASGSTDADNDPITYCFEYWGGLNWTEFARGTSVTHFLPVKRASYTAKYRVRAFDGTGYSGYLESGTFTVNASTYAIPLIDRADTTVVAAAYNTSGNGGRKLVRLANGWIVSVTKTTDYFYFYVSKDNGGGFVPLCFMHEANIDVNDIAISSKGTMVYVLSGRWTNLINFHQFDAETVQNVNIYNVNNYIDTQNAIGNVSLAINEAKTELHAAWSSKNNTYPNSFNIRYAKGTIAADGSVTWGAAGQVSAYNVSSTNAINPSIVVYNGNPIITFEYADSSSKRIGMFFNQAGWNYRDIYNGATYAQSNPSAIFVPQSINGLPNGRIWVAWNGLDSVDATYHNIRISYSDDGGATWSAPVKLTTGNTLNQLYPMLTANRSNQIFVLWSGQPTSNTIEVRKIKNTSGTWGSITSVTSVNDAIHKNPSALYDASFDFAEPLFIYRNQNNKVGFYGTWDGEPALPDNLFPNMYEFSGNGYVDIPSRMIPATGDFTVETHFKTASASAQTLLAFGTGLQITLNASGNIVLQPNGVTSSRSGLNDGKMRHVAVVQSGTQLLTYIDGSIDNIYNMASAPSYASISSLRVGASPTLTQFFTGQIGFPRFWSDVRTDAEISSGRRVVYSIDEQGLLNYMRIHPFTGAPAARKSFVYASTLNTNYKNLFVELANLVLPYPNNAYDRRNIEYLREKVNVFRSENSLPAVSWTDAIIVEKVTPIRALHLNEIQDAIEETYNLSGGSLADTTTSQKIAETIAAKDVRYSVRDFGNRLNGIKNALMNKGWNQ